MAELHCAVWSADGNILSQSEGDGFVNLVHGAEYCPGDRIVVWVSKPDAHLLLQLDDALDPSPVFLKGAAFEFPLPFGEQRLAYNPKAFTGPVHLIRVREATRGEIALYRNLAVNSYDFHENTCCFPHASANVETRGEAVFAARNAIDGNTENRSHGAWPFESWGINRDPNAELTVAFGRAVIADRILLYTRADFPHDSWWRAAQLSFSDGSTVDITMEKSETPHAITFAEKRISWVKLTKLRKEESDPSPFPALSQIEVWGHDPVSAAV